MLCILFGEFRHLIKGPYRRLNNISTGYYGVSPAGNARLRPRRKAEAPRALYLLPDALNSTDGQDRGH